MSKMSRAATDDELARRYSDYSAKYYAILREPTMWNAIERASAKLMERGKLNARWLADFGPGLDEVFFGPKMPMMSKDDPDSLEVRSRAGDARQFSASAARNCRPIREVLIRVLPKKGIALEIGSGTGEHVISFAKALPGLVWLPSDPDAASRASIEAWRATEGLATVHAPVALDVRQGVWGVEDDAPFDAMISLNMVHIAPWEAALGLLAGAGRLLRPGGVLFFYGPFMLGGAHTAASNAAFDVDLKRRNPRWGVRDLDELVSEAAHYGLELHEVVKMPAHNLSLVFVKAGPALPS